MPAASCGFDHHKKDCGRKRHLLTDTMGLLITAAVSPAQAADRDGAAVLLDCARTRGRTRLARVWGDNAYNGGAFAAWAAEELGITVEVVTQPKGQKGFQVLPAAGSSSAPTPGSPAGGAAPATTNATPATTPPGSTGPPTTR